MRSPAELAAIRAANRRAMGLGDVSADVASFAGDVVGQNLRSARVRTASPPVDYTYVPGANGQPGTTTQQQGGGATLWYTQHVLRPRIDLETPFGVITYDPGAGQSDWSGVANAALAVGGVVIVGGILYAIARALSRRRRNPRRTRYVLVRRAA